MSTSVIAPQISGLGVITKDSVPAYCCALTLAACSDYVKSGGKQKDLTVYYIHFRYYPEGDMSGKLIWASIGVGDEMDTVPHMLRFQRNYICELRKGEEGPDWINLISDEEFGILASQG
jgi:hypothetical protein